MPVCIARSACSCLIVQTEKGNSPSEKPLRTQGAFDCPSVNLALHLLEAVAQTRSTPTAIKHCVVIMASSRAYSSYSLHYSRVTNHWSWMAEPYYFPTALICWGALGDTSHPWSSPNLQGSLNRLLAGLAIEHRAAEIHHWGSLLSQVIQSLTQKRC